MLYKVSVSEFKEYETYVEAENETLAIQYAKSERFDYPSTYEFIVEGEGEETDYEDEFLQPYMDEILVEKDSSFIDLWGIKPCSKCGSVNVSHAPELYELKYYIYCQDCGFIISDVWFEETRAKWNNTYEEQNQRED